MCPGVRKVVLFSNLSNTYTEGKCGVILLKHVLCCFDRLPKDAFFDPFGTPQSNHGTGPLSVHKLALRVCLLQDPARKRDVLVR